MLLWGLRQRASDNRGRFRASIRSPAASVGTAEAEFLPSDASCCVTPSVLGVRRPSTGCSTGGLGGQPSAVVVRTWPRRVVRCRADAQATPEEREPVEEDAAATTSAALLKVATAAVARGGAAVRRGTDAAAAAHVSSGGDRQGEAPLDVLPGGRV